MQASVRRVPDSPLLMWGMVGFLVLLGGVFAVLFFMSSSSAPRWLGFLALGMTVLSAAIVAVSAVRGAAGVPAFSFTRQGSELLYSTGKGSPTRLSGTFVVGQPIWLLGGRIWDNSRSRWAYKVRQGGTVAEVHTSSPLRPEDIAGLGWALQGAGTPLWVHLADGSQPQNTTVTHLGTGAAVARPAVKARSALAVATVAQGSPYESGAQPLRIDRGPHVVKVPAQGSTLTVVVADHPPQAQIAIRGRQDFPTPISRLIYKQARLGDAHLVILPTPARTLDIYVDESGPGSLVWLHAVA